MFGFLTLSSREPDVGEPLYLPQHPGGGVKQVSVRDCQLSTHKLDSGAPDSDFGHQCDTEPGSSGASVLDLHNQVVGLHHFGGCTAAGGENQAVLMSQILPLLPWSSMTLQDRSRDDEHSVVSISGQAGTRAVRLRESRQERRTEHGSCG